MTKQQRTKVGRQRAGGFTVVELLVVIGIIVILVAILVPVVGTARKQAFAASTRAEIASLAAACERYYADFRAYPGPISNQEITNPGITVPAIAARQPGNPGDLSLSPGKLTMAENLVLGLMGGWEPGPTAGDPPSYKPDKVGQGPMSHNPVPSARRRASAYVDSTNWLSTAPGALGDAYAISGGSYQHVGSPVPEFMDRFPNARPILYLRARVGAPVSAANSATSTESGVAADDTLQYNSNNLGLAAFDSPNNAYVRPRAVPADQPADFDNPTPPPGDPNASSAPPPGPFTAQLFSKYLTAPGSTPPTNPRGKDRFILISAGVDGVYGTADDIFSE